MSPSSAEAMKFIGVSFLFLALFTGCAAPPPLRITHLDDGSVAISVETLGEYPTTISRIRISIPAEDIVVLDLDASSSPPQIWRSSLREGKNPTNLEGLPERAHYQLLVPEGACEFELVAGIEYIIEVWGKSERAYRKNAFRIGKGA